MNKCGTLVRTSYVEDVDGMFLLENKSDESLLILKNYCYFCWCVVGMIFCGNDL